MKQTKVITNFSKIRGSALETLGNTIVTSMTGNVHFPTLSADTSLVQAAVAAFTNALAAVPVGGRHEKALRDQKQEDLQDLLSELAIKVNLIAKGDKTLLTSSGFPLTKERSANRQVIEKARIESLKPGVATGAIRVKVAKVEGAAAFVYQYTEAPVSESSVWKAVYDGRQAVILHGLKVHAVYAFRVSAIGTDQDLDFSEPVTSIIL